MTVIIISDNDIFFLWIIVSVMFLAVTGTNCLAPASRINLARAVWNVAPFLLPVVEETSDFAIIIIITNAERLWVNGIWMVNGIKWEVVNVEQWAHA